MELPKIMIHYTIKDDKGKVETEGTFNFTNLGERRACAERFNKCLLEGYEVTTKRVRK